MDKQDLTSVVNDKSRKVSIRGNQIIVPLKFDEDGEVATPDKLIFKRLSLQDLRFLKVLRDNKWDAEKSAQDCGIKYDAAARLIKKLACFRQEDAKVKALAEIPSPEWIAAKHVENIYEGGQLDDSSHKSLQELAKCVGAYKNQAQVTINNNFLQMPALPQDAQEQLRALGDKLADVVEAEVAA